jgi:hypothetical protein
MGSIPIPRTNEATASRKMEDPNMAKVGNKSVLYSTTFLIAVDETFEDTVKAPDGSPLPIAITFKVPKDQQPAGGEWHAVDGKLQMTFYGWNSPLGTVMDEPEKFGEMNGRPAMFQVASYGIGDKRILVHLWIYVEG